MNYQAELESIWSETIGDPRIKVAILDGIVDGSHPSFAGAHLTFLPGMAGGDQEPGVMAIHGTHVTSVIAGQHSGPVRGVAPGCSAVIVPIFSDEKRTADQLNLARAIEQAVEAGAHVINISGGEFSRSGEPDTMLAK